MINEPEEDFEIIVEPIIVFDNWEGMPMLSIPAVPKDNKENKL